MLVDTNSAQKCVTFKRFDVSFFFFIIAFFRKLLFFTGVQVLAMYHFIR